VRCIRRRRVGGKRRGRCARSGCLDGVGVRGKRGERGRGKERVRRKETEWHALKSEDRAREREQGRGGMRRVLRREVGLREEG
jgi:hypothetical protein